MEVIFFMVMYKPSYTDNKYRKMFLRRDYIEIWICQSINKRAKYRQTNSSDDKGKIGDETNLCRQGKWERF